MSRALILLVEDDDSLRRVLTAGLRREGYNILSTGRGREACLLARSHRPDLVLLDLGLPDLEGLEVLRDLRSWSPVAVLILSARHQERQKVEALDLGADDYLTKPFGQGELQARIRAALRRQAPSPPTAAPLELGFLQIDLQARRVTRDGEPVRLTPLEWKLLEALVRRPGQVVTHRQLLTEVWGPAQSEQTHYLHIYVAQLRTKLEQDPARPHLFQCEPGVGYRFHAEAAP